MKASDRLSGLSITSYEFAVEYYNATINDSYRDYFWLSQCFKQFSIEADKIANKCKDMCTRINLIQESINESK